MGRYKKNMPTLASQAAKESEQSYWELVGQINPNMIQHQPNKAYLKEQAYQEKLRKRRELNG